MKTHARQKYLHVAPRKARLVANLVRGLDLEDALSQLTYTNKKSSYYFKKLLESAAANAEHNYGMIRENLYVSEIKVDGATPFKRWQPRAFGRAYPILKRTSHLTVVLDEKEKGMRRKGFKKKVEAVEADIAKESEKKEAKKPEAVKRGFLRNKLLKGEKKQKDLKRKGKLFQRKSG